MHRTAAATALLVLVAEIAVVAVSTIRPSRALAVQAPTGQGFTVTPGDLHFIMKQIKIAEHHSQTLTASNPCGTLVGPDRELQVPDRLTPYGLRTVDGSCNNLFPGRERYAAADEVFPRLTTAKFRDAEPSPPAFGPPTPTTYKQKTGLVFDSTPRVVSNLIVDQTSSNPAAVAAAGHPVRSQDPTPSAVPCSDPPAPTDPPDCVPPHKTLFIPNVTTDVGLSPPYNSWFTFFGQFFDHGVDQTVKSGGTVFVPLRADDPLRTLGPDGDPNTPDQVPPSQAFMVLTRAKNQPGPDGVLGTDDDVQEATNTDTPLVDQSQTYTSHPTHQAFLREYVASTNGRDGVAGTLDDGGPVATGNLLGDPERAKGPDGLAGTPDDLIDSGMATWASVKRQARSLLGINLTDPDLLDMPMLAADPYGEFIPGPNGLPQLVTKGPDGKPNTADDVLVEGTLPTPRDVPADVVRFDTPFVGDIAHNADPSPRQNPDGTTTTLHADADNVINDPNRPLAEANAYDDELLDTHFCAGDGRANENIALSAVHQIFHSEHDRLVDDIKHTLATDPSAEGVADLNSFWKPTNPTPAGGPNVPVDASGWAGDRLFQAARFVTEMEYQHLVFEEFARKIQPAIRPFHVYNPDANPVIPAEFAHAVYRFGHSMLDDDVARMNDDPALGPKNNSLPLLKAFLNPPEYFNPDPALNARDLTAKKYTPEQAAGAIIMGSVDQAGNELDEFVTETLRNNLLGLPLDLPTINMTRAREAGVPPLNEVRREIHAKTNDAQMMPYTDWADYGQHLKHPESLVNYVAAYGEHPTIRDSGPDGVKGTADDVLTVKEKRDAARAIVDPLATDTPPADASDFMFGTGTWAGKETGINKVDLWVGGLGEVTSINGGLLGSTFNYVFQNTLENLQDFDRFYYLARTPGLNLRTQLEGNSFAELIQRNTDGTHTLKADVFATADCKFELKNLVTPAPAGSAITGPGSVGDDPTSDCDENALLLQKADGTIQYRTRNTVDPPGINGQSVFNGTPAVDRVLGGVDNDTFWGGLGDDIVDLQAGDDVAQGGEGNDVITDLDGADILEGGDGNDAIDAGPGDDLLVGGNGKDFTEGGSLDNETFGGPGDDFINAGQGADAVFGDGGDDWIQGGTGQDLLQGDHGAPFFDDPGESHPGNDVFVGQPGENDYDTEGGDDLMAQNAAIDRNAGAGGFDWAFHQYDTVGAEDDMMINKVLDALPLPIVVNRDRWQETEGNSGSPFNDTIKGDDDVPATVGGAGFTGCDALDQAGVDRIRGLADLLPPMTRNAADVALASATGTCPLSGPVWGEGNILLGGGGGDTIEGRGGDDIIDGDKALHVHISVRTNPADPATEIGTTDLMEHTATSGTFGPGTDGMTLSEAVFAGKVDTGNLVIAREIVTEPTTPGTIDTAVFSGPRADYDITPDINATKMTITHARGAQTDGTDIVTNVERLVFLGDQTVTIAPVAALSTNRTFAARQIGLATPSASQTVTLSNTGTTTLNIASVALTGANPGDFVITSNACGATLAAGVSCDVAVAFKPTAAGARSAILRATDDSNGVAGSTQDVTLSGTGTVGPPPSNPATGVPLLSDTTPSVDPNTTGSVGTATPIAAPVATPLGQALAPRTAPPAALRSGAVTASGTTASPLTVVATVPPGATTVRISVFRLLKAGKRGSKKSRAGANRLRVATVYRNVSGGKRYVFRLKEKALRGLKPGRYLVEVRVGTSPKALGPARTTVVTIRRAKHKSAR